MRVMRVVIWLSFIVFPGVAAAFSNDASWEATYPFGQAPAQKIVTAGLAPGYLEATSTVAGQEPPANSAVSSEHSLSSRSAITQSRPIGSPRGASKPPAWWTRPFHPHPPQAQNQMLYRAAAPSPWYETPLGIAGIGVVATGATMFLDHGINHYTETHLSYGFRNHVALNIADVLTDGSLIIAGASWFQSPWASAKFAHASSVALTSAAITTIEVFAIKYAIVCT